MKKNNKGFTLIELLAVIVILAILVAVAIPSVTKYLNDARRGSMHNITKPGNFVFNIGGKTATWKPTTGNEVPIDNVVQKNLAKSPYGNDYQAAYVEVSRNNETGESKFKLYLSDGIYCFYTDATKEDDNKKPVLDLSKKEGVDESNLNNEMFLIAKDECAGLKQPEQ